MRSFLRGMLFMMALCCLVGWSGNDDGLRSVTFTDHGAVVPNPVVTTVSITPGFLSFSRAQNGSLVEKWSKRISAADFSSLKRIVADYKLYESGNVVPAGPPSCLGARGMTIGIGKGELVHSFDIDGGVYCDRSQWPAGVRKLVDLEDRLLEKYK